MKLHLAHHFHKATDNLLNHLRSHRWHMNVYKSDMEGHNYYLCKKTGDRKVETNTLRDPSTVRAIDEEWLKAGSGRYYINGQENGEPTNAEEAIKKVRHALAAEKKRRIDNQYLLFHDNTKKRRTRPRAISL